MTGLTKIIRYQLFLVKSLSS